MLWPIAVITFKEGMRNRALYGILLFALIMLLTILFLAAMPLHDFIKIAVDIALSSVAVAGLLLVLFVGINLIARDLDRRTVYVILSRPISRPQYVVGKFLGMMLLIVTALCLLTAASLFSLVLVTNFYPDTNAHFSWQPVLLAFVFIILMYILLSSITFFFSSFVSTSFITLILTVLTYLIGISLQDIRSLIEASRSGGVHIPVFTQKLVQFAFYLFPNLSLFDIKLQAAHGLPVPLTYSFPVLLYGIAYTVMIITAAAVLSKKKELP